jgi:hypothetical protein
MIRNAVEATMDAHPEWAEADAEEERKQGREPDMAKIRENAITGAIVMIMMGNADYVTRRDGWREKVSALTEMEIESAVHELSKYRGYEPAKRADLHVALERHKALYGAKTEAETALPENNGGDDKLPGMGGIGNMPDSS